MRDLPFGEVRQDGLTIHEAVQSAVPGRFMPATPFVTEGIGAQRGESCATRSGAGPDDLWRYTADMLYLIENPVVREAFFPSGAQPLAVEPATSADLALIEHIAERHDGPDGRRLMVAWWRHQPSAFSVVRDRDGQVTGFHLPVGPRVRHATARR